MNPRLQISSNPHARSDHDTLHEMLNVVLALIPASVFGIFHFGIHSLLVILLSIAAAMATEYIFDVITRRGNTLWDGSAVVTGLLLALISPPTVPLFIPIAGSIFAILFTKCFFGGLGQNFMNPALAGRAFLLISFGTLMTNYSVDGVSSATPLAQIAQGGSVNPLHMLFGFTDGHIGISVFCLLLGGVWLLYTGTITWHIPVSTLLSFVILMGIFGGHGFDPAYLLCQLFGGGIVMGAFFMATDPVTSPISPPGQIVFGILIGTLSMVFRVFSSYDDGTTYAIIVANLVVPFLDKALISRPFGIGRHLPAARVEGKKVAVFMPRSAVILAVITLLAGAALAGINALTASRIATNQAEKNLASFEAVQPEAAEITFDDAVSKKVSESVSGDGYYEDDSYGRVLINEVAVGKDASGNVTGYAINLTTFDAYDGEITQTVGINADGTVTGILFTSISETPGMGMLADTEEWRGQFDEKKVDEFILLKSGGADEDHEIDSVSGASTTSGAVVNAVNAALDFYRDKLQ